MSPDKNKYPYCSYTLHSERKTLNRRVDSEQMYHLLNVTVVLGATVPRVETLRVRAPPTAPRGPTLAGQRCIPTHTQNESAAWNLPILSAGILILE